MEWFVATLSALLCAYGGASPSIEETLLDANTLLRDVGVLQPPAGAPPLFLPCDSVDSIWAHEAIAGDSSLRLVAASFSDARGAVLVVHSSKQLDGATMASTFGTATLVVDGGSDLAPTHVALSQVRSIAVLHFPPGAVGAAANLDPTRRVTLRLALGRSKRFEWAELRGVDLDPGRDAFVVEDFDATHNFSVSVLQLFAESKGWHGLSIVEGKDAYFKDGAAGSFTKVDAPWITSWIASDASSIAGTASTRAALSPVLHSVELCAQQPQRARGGVAVCAPPTVLLGASSDGAEGARSKSADGGEPIAAALRRIQEWSVWHRLRGVARLHVYLSDRSEYEAAVAGGGGGGDGDGALRFVHWAWKGGDARAAASAAQQHCLASVARRDWAIFLAVGDYVQLNATAGRTVGAALTQICASHTDCANVVVRPRLEVLSRCAARPSDAARCGALDVEASGCAGACNATALAATVIVRPGEAVFVGAIAASGALSRANLAQCWGQALPSSCMLGARTVVPPAPLLRIAHIGTQGTETLAPSDLRSCTAPRVADEILLDHGQEGSSRRVTMGEAMRARLSFTRFHPCAAHRSAASENAPALRCAWHQSAYRAAAVCTLQPCFLATFDALAQAQAVCEVLKRSCEVVVESRRRFAIGRAVQDESVPGPRSGASGASGARGNAAERLAKSEVRGRLWRKECATKSSALLGDKAQLLAPVPESPGREANVLLSKERPVNNAKSARSGAETSAAASDGVRPVALSLEPGLSGASAQCIQGFDIGGSVGVAPCITAHGAPTLATQHWLPHVTEDSERGVRLRYAPKPAACLAYYGSGAIGESVGDAIVGLDACAAPAAHDVWSIVGASLVATDDAGESHCLTGVGGGRLQLQPCESTNANQRWVVLTAATAG